MEWESTQPHGIKHVLSFFMASYHIFGEVGWKDTPTTAGELITTAGAALSLFVNHATLHVGCLSHVESTMYIIRHGVCAKTCAVFFSMGKREPLPCNSNFHPSCRLSLNILLTYLTSKTL